MANDPQIKIEDFEAFFVEPITKLPLEFLSLGQMCLHSIDFLQEHERRRQATEYQAQLELYEMQVQQMRDEHKELAYFDDPGQVLVDRSEHGATPANLSTFDKSEKQENMHVTQEKSD